MTKKILMIAGEISGDLYGARLAEEIQKIDPTAEISGVGGYQMKNAGIKILTESVSWGTIGFIEALKQVPKLFLVIQKLKKYIKKTQPDLIVLIDYPGFNMQIVNFAEKIGIKTAYYVPPSKWAKNPGTVKDAASKITKVLATYSTTEELYKSAGGNVVMVGHPVIDVAKVNTPREKIYEFLKLSPEQKIVGLLPGSREKEISLILPVLIKTAKKIHETHPEIKFIIPILSTTMQVAGLSEKKIKRMIKKAGVKIQIVVDRTYEVLSILDFAIITSGTATIEATCFHVPMIIIYKVSFLTEIFAKFISHLPPFFGLPNIILKRPAVPEFLQKEVTPVHLAEETIKYLFNRDLYYEQKCALREVVHKLGNKGAIYRAAKVILEMMKDPDEKRSENKKVGLIAGNGRFPLLLAEEAIKKGYEVVAVAISEEADVSLEKTVTKYHNISITNIDKIFDVLKKEGITEVLYAGKIKKTIMYSGLKFDLRLQKILKSLKDRNDDSILNAISDELEKEGVRVIDSKPFLKRFLPEKGILTSTPTEEEWLDLKYAYNVAKQIAGIDIGQTVAVRNQAVLAIEAIEGTDEAILRAGKLGKEGVVVAKVAKPSQDMRFDIPAIGLNTIEVLKKANVRALVIDSGLTIILDKEELFKKANEYNICIVAL
jgi:lipid-A-disaccharide synthase